MLITESEVQAFKSLPRNIHGFKNAVQYAENQLVVLYGSNFVKKLNTEEYKDIFLGNKDVKGIKELLAELVYKGLLRNENVFFDNVGFVQKKTKDSELINARTRCNLMNQCNKNAFQIFKNQYVYLKRNNEKYPEFDDKNLGNIFTVVKIETI